MREVLIKNEFDRSYLLIGNEGLEDSYEYNMLINNKISGILDCKPRYWEENSYCSYDISSKKSLEQEYTSKKMGFTDLMDLFYGIHMSIKKAGEYLLKLESFLFLPQYIFLDLDSGELECLYFPDFEQDLLEKKEAYRALADFLLDKVDHKDEHAVNITYHFYKISKEDFFSFDSFVGFLEKESLLVQAKEKKESVGEEDGIPIRIREMDFLREDEEDRDAAFLSSKEESYKWWIPGVMLLIGAVFIMLYIFVPLFKKYAIYALLLGLSIIVWAVILLIRNLICIYKDRKESEYISENEPVRIEEYFDDMMDDVTVFFDKEEYLCLKWKEGRFSKEYSMDSFPLTVGKMREGIQIEMNDLSVSRLHAKFRKQGNSIWLQDLDSTNGTYVNGRRLQSGEEAIIKRGDEIQFGKIIVNVV